MDFHVHFRCFVGNVSRNVNMLAQVQVTVREGFNCVSGTDLWLLRWPVDVLEVAKNWKEEGYC